MSKSMFVNVVNEEETRIAAVVDGKLEDLTIATGRDETIEGNIYKARIDKVLPSLDAAFVDFGRERNGFLALSEIRPEYFTNGDRRSENLKRGQELLVQVKKGEIGEKGAALTTYISIPGRYLVIMPFVGKQGVSRQIQDEAMRKTLREVLDGGALPEGMGYIVRTAAGDQKKQDLQRDLNFLLRLWKRILAQNTKAKAPALLYRESDMVIRTLRDYFTSEIDEVLVDDEKVHERVIAFFRAVMPWHAKKVQFYDGRAPLFSKHNIEAQIESIHEEKVKLPSGGSIVIQQTEALVSVDVNSGAGAKNKDIEQTALATNLEAAHEAARQLKLRDLGGLVVLDFIDMRSSASRNAVRKELQKALKTDKARTDVGTISKFGLLELSRQRLRGASAPRLSSTCPLCGGGGTLRNAQSFALSVLRTIQAVLAKGKRVKTVRVGADAEAAAYLLNRKRRQIGEMEALFHVSIEIYAEPELPPNRYYIAFTGAEKPRVETNLPSDYPAERLLCVKTPPPEDFGDVSGGISYEAMAEPGELAGEEPEESAEIQAPTPSRPAGEPEAHARKPEPVAEAEPGETPAEGEKKRRRRRRRKKRGGGQDGQAPQAQQTQQAPQATPAAAPAAQPAPEAREPQEAVELAEQPGDAPGTAQGNALGDAPRKRRRSRGRRRRGSKGGMQNATGANTSPGAEAPASATPAPTPVPSPAPVREAPAPATPAAEQAPAAKKPRKRPSRKAAPKAETPAPAAAAPAPEAKPAKPPRQPKTPKAPREPKAPKAAAKPAPKPKPEPSASEAKPAASRRRSPRRPKKAAPPEE